MAGQRASVSLVIQVKAIRLHNLVIERLKSTSSEARPTVGPTIGTAPFYQRVRQRWKSVKWGEYYSDGLLARALLDRLVEGAIILEVKGKSYRADKSEISGIQE